MNPSSMEPSKEETEKWEKRLVGKWYVSDTDKNFQAQGVPSADTFRDKDLPSNHRVLPPGSMMTLDLRVERLNVHLDDEGKVTHVQFG